MDRIHYNDLVRYIDDDKHAKDWRYVKNLEPSKQKLLDKWVAIHKAKTTCDCCHHRMKEYCKTCKNAMKTFYQDRKKNNQGKKNEDKDNSKFVGCESCVKKGAWTTKCYDHDHLTGKYRATLCSDCNFSK